MVAGGDGGEDAAEEGADGGEHQLVGGEHPVPAHQAQAGHLPRLLVQHRQMHLRLLQCNLVHRIYMSRFLKNMENNTRTENIG